MKYSYMDNEYASIINVLCMNSIGKHCCLGCKLKLLHDKKFFMN